MVLCILEIIWQKSLLNILSPALLTQSSLIISDSVQALEIHYFPFLAFDR